MEDVTLITGLAYVTLIKGFAYVTLKTRFEETLHRWNESPVLLVFREPIGKVVGSRLH
jgi:hypothetical protein